MGRVVTVRLGPDLAGRLDRVAKLTGRSRSEIVREALRRRLDLLRFEFLRRRVLPFAQTRGYLTDEDVTRTKREEHEKPR